jgi:nucleotide exchange factor SIL1
MNSLLRRRRRHNDARTSNATRQSSLGYRTTMLLMWLACCACVFFGSASLSQGKEIEATSEWTLLGENDTVAAGMHIRMDLTTGEKWVKQIMEDDDENENDASLSQVVVAMTQVVDVDANGKTVPQQQQQQEDNKTNHSSNNNKQPQQEPNYDYEMMHRTLSKLPPDEQQRIGGLPELVDRAASKLTPEQRRAFEIRMKQIWESRQEELRQMQNDHLVDLPQLLQDRIHSLKAYLANPIQGLQELKVSLATTASEEKNKEELQEEGGTIGNHIVAVLQDLEYQLTDLDMARDFHTLGGWPILSSLLADAIHESHSTNNTQQILSDEDWNNVNLIQALAAWVIGTAVKNTDEFSPYATEEVQVLLAPGSVVKTTALDLVLAQFIAACNAIVAATDLPNKDDYYDTVMMKVHKTLYALGAMLRANRQAQTHFCADEGPSLLVDVLAQLADQAQLSTNYLPNDSMKVAQRLLSLAQDIVMDVTLHSSTSEQVDQAIGNAFSNAPWCKTVLRFVSIPRLYETTLLTMRHLAPYCEWDDVTTEQVIQQLQQPPDPVLESWLQHDLEPDERKERLELLQSTVQAIQQSQKQ